MSCYKNSGVNQGCTYTASGEFKCGYGGGDGTSIILNKPTSGYGECSVGLKASANANVGVGASTCTMCAIANKK